MTAFPSLLIISCKGNTLLEKAFSGKGNPALVGPKSNPSKTDSSEVTPHAQQLGAPPCSRIVSVTVPSTRGSASLQWGPEKNQRAAAAQRGW